MFRAFVFVPATVLGLLLSAQAAEPKIPILHSTDLLHPFDDPDDHYDLACLFALEEFDLKGVILDLGDRQNARPGRPAVEQMMQITGRKCRYAVGLGKQLSRSDDPALQEPEAFQGGVQLILDALRSSSDRVVIHLAGSCRDLAAAFNREPALLREKVRAVYINIGNGPRGEQDEWNVTLDPLAYLRVLESGLPVYWCPCRGKDGYQTFYKADQSAVVGACALPVQNFFTYCLSRSKADPLAFLSTGPHPLPTGNRNMWCTAPLLHAAGRKIYQRGPEDFVALRSQDAQAAGLAGKVVEAYQFVPVRVSVEKLPEPGKEGKPPSWPRLAVELNPPQANCYLFRSVDPRYETILASCLKNILIDMGR